MEAIPADAAEFEAVYGSRYGVHQSASVDARRRFTHAEIFIFAVQLQSHAAAA